MSSQVHSSVPPPTPVPVDVRPPVVVQLPTVSTLADSVQSPVPCGTPPQGSVQIRQTPNLASGTAEPVTARAVHPVSSQPVSEQVLPAPQHSVQSSIVSRNTVQQSLGLPSFVAVTDPHNTFKQGNKADEQTNKSELSSFKMGFTTSSLRIRGARRRKF